MFGNHGNSSKKPKLVNPVVVAAAKREHEQRVRISEERPQWSVNGNLAQMMPQGVC